MSKSKIEVNYPHGGKKEIYHEDEKLLNECSQGRAQWQYFDPFSIYEIENDKDQSSSPYLSKKVLVFYNFNEYNPDYGDERICRCGHTYGRHFDSYDEMSPVGCKYCDCFEFVEGSDLNKPT